MFKFYNPNPLNKRVGDCTVRAISKLLDQSWEETYTGLTVEGFCFCDMPSANAIWGSYLKNKGFERCIIPNDYPDFYSVEDFCKDNPKGRFLLTLSSHVVTIIDGCAFDTWDSSGEVVIYYWRKKE